MSSRVTLGLGSKRCDDRTVTSTGWLVLPNMAIDALPLICDDCTGTSDNVINNERIWRLVPDLMGVESTIPEAPYVFTIDSEVTISNPGTVVFNVSDGLGDSISGHGLNEAQTRVGPSQTIHG